MCARMPRVAYKVNPVFEMSKESLKSSWFLWGVACVAIFFNLVEMWQPLVQMDDAYISYRYAQNFADGHGLVFNKGEYVEGYSNFLWTILVAVGVYFGLAAPVAGHVLMIASTVFFLVATLFLTYAVLPDRYKNLAVISPFALLASNSFAAWSVSGLETALFGGFVTLALYFCVRGKMFSVAAVCILASLTRPEGVLLAGVLLGLSWIASMQRQRLYKWQDLLLIAMPCILFFLYLVIHTLFRYFYYGDVLPNTFYAKVGGVPVSRGIDYIRKFLVDGPGLFIIPFFIACVVTKKMRLVGIYVIFTFVYAAVIGGDAFRLGRFLLPILPALIAGVLVCSAYCMERQTWLGVSVAALLLLGSLVSLYGPWRSGTDFEGVGNNEFPISAKRVSARDHFYAVSDEAIIGWAKNIELISPKINKIATVGIGKPGYFLMDVAILDLVGLTNKEVAKSSRVVEGAFVIPGHQRANANYIFSQKPDLIMIPQKGKQGPIQLPAVKELLESSVLEELYFWDEGLQLYWRRQSF